MNAALAVPASGIDAPDLHGRLAAALREALDAQEVKLLGLKRLSGGAIQENWRLALHVRGGTQPGTVDAVLRTDAVARLTSSRSRAEEFALLRHVHRAGVPVPRPIVLVEDPAWIGRPFFIMDFHEGIAAGHRLAREDALLPDRDRLARQLAAALARIHALRPPQPALAFFGAVPAAPTRALITRLRAQLDSLQSHRPAIEWGLRRLEVAAPAGEAVTLVHRDFRSGNYLVHEGALAAVLDWEFAGWGNPLEDLGWLTARCWRFGRNELEAGGVAPLQPLLDAYAAESGAAVTREQLAYWQLLAHCRWAVIALEQVQRHVSGVERSLELALTGRLVSGLELEILRQSEALS